MCSLHKPGTNTCFCLDRMVDDILVKKRIAYAESESARIDWKKKKLDLSMWPGSSADFNPGENLGVTMMDRAENILDYSKKRQYC